MFAGLDQLACQDLAVPLDVMEHVVRVESSFNPFAIGVVGGRLVRQPESLREALATARMLEDRGYNFSLGLAQVNRHNLGRYGLASYEAAFESCPNLRAGARILAECHQRTGGDWGRAFSCYYSGNTVTGFRHGYVQKVFASMRDAEPTGWRSGAIQVVGRPTRRQAAAKRVSARWAPAAGDRSDVPSVGVATPATPAGGQLPASVDPVDQVPSRGAEARDHAFVF
jgi:type IV secretion system protein VirB1